MNTLIQCAHGRAYERLIETSRVWHLKVLPDWHHSIFFEPRGHRPPTWDKCRRVLKALHAARNGEFVLFLYCDALIRETLTMALEIALAGADFGAVENVWGVFNGGMTVWRATARTRECAEIIDRE